jgi:hypothetical protein
MGFKNYFIIFFIKNIIMETILNKIFTHYLDQSELLLKEKEVLSIQDLKLCEKLNRNVTLYCNENYFIKIEYRKANQKKYLLELKSSNKCTPLIYNPNNLGVQVCAPKREVVCNFELPICLNNDYLLLQKFPKEIIINGIIRKELPNNIIKIKKYYFSDEEQILVMEHAGITFKDFILNNIKDYDAINTKVYEIFIIIAILQNKFKFMHKDLKCENITMKKINDEYNTYILNDKKYKIKSYGYIPVLIDMATSTIFKIYNKDFEIYNFKNNPYTHDRVSYPKYINSKLFIGKYEWYMRDVNRYIEGFDIYRLIYSISLSIDISKIKIIRNYFEASNIKNYDFSEDLLSPSIFLEKFIL